MQLSVFSKIVLKKISIFPLFLLFLIPPCLSGQTVQAEIRDNEIILKVTGYPSNDLLSSLKEGFRASAKYTIRIYRYRTGLFRIIGDILISEEQIFYEGMWDDFTHTYLLLQGEDRQFYQDPWEFLSEFLTLEGHPLPLLPEKEGEYYLLCRVEVENLLLRPPLTLLQGIMSNYVSQWAKLPVTKNGRNSQ